MKKIVILFFSCFILSAFAGVSESNSQIVIKGVDKLPKFQRGSSFKALYAIKAGGTIISEFLGGVRNFDGSRSLSDNIRNGTVITNVKHQHCGGKPIELIDNDNRVLKRWNKRFECNKTTVVRIK